MEKLSHEARVTRIAVWLGRKAQEQQINRRVGSFDDPVDFSEIESDLESLTQEGRYRLGCLTAATGTGYLLDEFWARKKGEPLRETVPRGGHREFCERANEIRFSAEEPENQWRKIYERVKKEWEDYCPYKNYKSFYSGLKGYGLHR